VLPQTLLAQQPLPLHELFAGQQVVPHFLVLPLAGQTHVPSLQVCCPEHAGEQVATQVFIMQALPVPQPPQSFVRPQAFVTLPHLFVHTGSSQHTLPWQRAAPPQGVPLGRPWQLISQRAGVQATAQVSVVVWQTPLMHFLVVRTEPLQVGVPHWKPSASRPQPPLPSQELLHASLAQVPFGSAPPLGTFAQTPCWPVSPQDLQTPSQAVPQQ
jgi:hypothetical protein